MIAMSKGTHSETGQESTSISEPDYLTINVKNVANGVDALNAAQEQVLKMLDVQMEILQMNQLLEI